MSYDRESLVAVLVYHQRLDAGHCACGWGVLGESHAEHVADVYEMELAANEADERGNALGAFLDALVTLITAPWLALVGDFTEINEVVAALEKETDT